LSRAGYVYKITNLLNNKWYIGSHLGVTNIEEALNDNYLGSGKRLWYAYNKYGFDNFKKEVIAISEDARLTETNFLEYLDAENAPDSYNMSNRADPPIHYGDSNPQRNPEVRKRTSETLRKLAAEGRHWSQSKEGRRHMSDMSTKLYSNSEFREKKVLEGHSSIGIKAKRLVPLKCLETGEVFDGRSTVCEYYSLTYNQVNHHLDRGSPLGNDKNLVRISKDEFLNTPENLRITWQLITSKTISSQASDK